MRFECETGEPATQDADWGHLQVRLVQYIGQQRLCSETGYSAWDNRNCVVRLHECSMWENRDCVVRLSAVCETIGTV